jgi:hypothetical protein
MKGWSYVWAILLQGWCQTLLRIEDESGSSAQKVLPKCLLGTHQGIVLHGNTTV